MPRHPRQDFDGAIQHAYSRGNNKIPIFLDDEDRRRFLTTLAEVIARKNWRVMAYCLMPNHFHMLLETPEGNLGRGMQRLLGDYARDFNDRHERSGHLFQGRYGAKLVTTDEQLYWVAEYIADNPVKAGLCRTPEDWAWGSRGAARARHAPDWLDLGRLSELTGLSLTALLRGQTPL
jgi:putative transposase